MRIHKGVFIYGSRGKYNCDLIEDTFKTLKDIKEYINDYKNCEK